MSMSGSKITLMLLSILLVLASAAGACTTILVTAGATVDGSLYVTHSDDNELMDERIIFVPAMDHEPGSMRPVYCSATALGPVPEYNSFLEPRLVCSERGPGYDTSSSDSLVSIPLGYIPQVPHTYAYFDGTYGIMNEHQLMIGECTNSARWQLAHDPEKRIFYSSELSRVALERCTTAREAVLLMGSLIDEYGYYGTGETIPVGDPDEGWVFEMCCGSVDSTGGLWVAQRVPDGGVFVAANEFRIREIDPSDPDILYSPDLFEQVEALGWWDPSMGPLDWLEAVAVGECRHPYDALRRVWRVSSLVAPSLELSPWVENGNTDYYPFSVEPDTLLSTRGVMRLHRDHFEGTQFDMTQGPAAGPFGYPNRHYGEYDDHGFIGWDTLTTQPGAWERPISAGYVGFVSVCQGRSWLPDPVGGVCWIGCDKPAETCFVPFYCGVKQLPECYQTGDTRVFSRDSAWWAFNFVSNWAELKYSYMIRDINALQDSIELAELAQMRELEEKVVPMYPGITGMAANWLTEFSISNAEAVVSRWWSLADMLIAKYDDGYVNTPGSTAFEVGYPQWWLDEVGYADGPVGYPEADSEE
jgi:dipeptidase